MQICSILPSITAYSNTSSFYSLNATISLFYLIMLLQSLFPFVKEEVFMLLALLESVTLCIFFLSNQVTSVIVIIIPTIMILWTTQGRVTGDQDITQEFIQWNGSHARHSRLIYIKNNPFSFSSCLNLYFCYQLTIHVET